MFPHEEFLQKALEECMITTLVHDLGGIYTKLVNRHGTNDDFAMAMKVEQILNKAADEIAALGPKPYIPHPLDKRN